MAWEEDRFEMTANVPRRLRADAIRNEQALIRAAAEAFLETGVETPVRTIAARAGVTTGTLYRRFPVRAELILAVYRQQMDALVESARVSDVAIPMEALLDWVDRFVDFLVTKRGLASALHSDDPCYDPLHEQFLARIRPAFAALVSRALGPAEGIDEQSRAHMLLHAIAALCIADHGDIGQYDAHLLSRSVIRGLS